MANILKREKQVRVVSSLAEGLSIRSIERMTGIHRDTIMRLGVRVGRGCTQILSKMMNNLRCRRIQVDEIWGFVGKKQRNVKHNEFGVGHVWTFVAIDPESKAVPCFRVGQRDLKTSGRFICDLSNRLANRVQISSDSLRAYVDAIKLGFGGDVDYGQIVKAYSSTKPLPASSRYSPPNIVSVRLTPIVGNPVEISKAYRQKKIRRRKTTIT